MKHMLVLLMLQMGVTIMLIVHTSNFFQIPDFFPPVGYKCACFSLQRDQQWRHSWWPFETQQEGVLWGHHKNSWQVWHFSVSIHWISYHCRLESVFRSPSRPVPHVSTWKESCCCIVIGGYTLEDMTQPDSSVQSASTKADEDGYTECSSCHPL